jgi:lambda family phage tail tape measure protein
MAKPIETLSIQLKFKDAGSQAVIEKLKGSLKRLELGASGAKPRIASLRKEILSQGQASVKSVSNINAQRTALSALRDEAKIGGRAFNQLTKDIAKLDAQMGKSAKSANQRRGGARQATQVAGAVISGGIFGGPEGALGAVGGAALGGVEGAFAGAAIGAQLGGIRQALGAAAEYSAEIGKLKIALEGVTRSEQGASASQANFAEALDAAAEATRNYNVPQGAAIAGITRLTAAVTGAGGPVADAATTFQNVTAAIKATGGSTEDVRGAITAMVQVFSKGKVSAEELSGQLGERLPGAVTLFAKANKMTLPELQKNLKAGTVGLNELMTFIRQLGEEFDGTAKDIASSNEEAGARLTVAFDNMKLSVGDALKDTGAEFQNVFGQFIEEITPNAVKAAEELAKALVPVAKNLDVILAALTGMAAGAVIGAVVKGIIAFKAAVVTAGSATAALTAIMAANPIFLGIAAVGGIVAGIYAINKAINGQADALERVKKAGAAEGATGAEKAEAISTVKAQIAEQKRIIADNQAGGGARASAAKAKRRQAAERELRRLQGQLADITRVRKKDKAGEEFKYDPVTPDGSDDPSGTDVKDISKQKADALIAQIGLRRRDVELTKEQIQAAAHAAREAAKALPTQKQRVELAKINNQEANQIFALEQKQARTAKNKARAQNELNELLAKAKGEQGILNDKQLQQELNQIKVNELMLKFNILVEQGVYNADELREKIEAAVAAMNKAESPMETFKNGLKEIFEAALDVNQALAERGVQAVQEFGDAFADFVATGKGNFRDFANSLIADLARIFARLALFQTLAAVIPGAGKFLGLAGFSNGGVVKGMTPPTTMPDSVSLMAANGMAFAKNKIVPYAKGGIVGRPTFFQYASGGAGRFGLMGEAGPEAIMPLRRGSNGKLGVEASGAAMGNITVNVDAAGSSVEGDASQANQLGKAIGIAVQQELIKQKRPGGLLAS